VVLSLFSFFNLSVFEMIVFFLLFVSWERVREKITDMLVLWGSFLLKLFFFIQNWADGVCERKRGP